MKYHIPLASIVAAAVSSSAVAGVFTFTSTSVTAFDRTGFGSQSQFDAPSFSTLTRDASAFEIAPGPGGITNLVGISSATAQARAGVGTLGTSSSVFIQSFGPSNPLKASAGVRADPGAGTVFDTEGANAQFTASDLTITPIPGASVASSGTVTARLNLNMEGYFIANGLGGIGGTGSTATRLSLQVRFGYVDPVSFQQGGAQFDGEVTMSQTTGSGALFDGGSGLLAGFAGGPISIQTGSMNLPVGTPIQLSVRLGLLTEVQAEGTTEYGGGADLIHTLTLPTTGPVMSLPEGYSLQSTDLMIADNVFSSVPEPAHFAALSGMVLLAFGLVRRRSGVATRRETTDSRE